MSSRILLSAIACLAAYMLSCNNPSGSNPVTTADQYEPDNSRESAKRMTPDSANQARTLKSQDTDWVYFSANAGKAYKIFTTGKTDTKIKVYSSLSSTPVVEGDDSPGDLNASVTLYCSSTGTYYVCISGNTVEIVGDYTLHIVSSIGPDAYESDSVPRAARSLSTLSYQSRTLTPGDVDWAYCNLGSDDSILVTATGTCPTAITLYDRDTTTSLASSSSSDSVASIRYHLTNSGTYFVKITSRDAGKSGSYRLVLATNSSGTLVVPDAFEDDNSRATAKFISGNGTAQQRSLTARDTDWVKLRVVEGRQYTLTSSNSSYISETMFAKDGTLLQGPSSSLSLNCSASDTVYVQIVSASTTPLNYTLTLYVSLQPTIPDEYEPDNTRAHAKAKFFPKDSLFQDRTITVSNYVSDTDWVAFAVSAGKRYTIQAITSSQTSLYQYLYTDASSSYVKYASYSNTEMTYTPATADTLYLVLYQSSSSAAIAYTLSVRGGYENDSYEPDSIRAKASQLTTSSQSRIIAPGDIDWAMYTATPGDSIAVVTTGTTDTKIALFSSSGSTPLQENDDQSATNTNAMVAWKSPLGGQYYVRVTGKTPAVAGPYTLQALSVMAGTLVAPDSFEVDNSKAKARLIKDSTLSAEAHSLHMNDTDMIAIPVVMGGQYYVSGSASSGYLNMYLYTSKDSLIYSRTSYSSPYYTLVAMKNDTIFCAFSSSTTVARYTISMSRTLPPGPDAYESDNTIETARFIKDSSLAGEVHSLPLNDTDWIALPVVTGGQYLVYASSSSYLSMYLYSARDSLIDGRSSSSSPSITYLAPKNDTVYYCVFSSSTVRNYTLSMSRTLPLPPDAYENDNTRALAKPIVPDSVQSHTLGLKDTDWVVIPVVSGSTYRVTTQAAFTHYTYLYLASSGSYYDYKYGSSSTFSLAATANDTLFVRISQYSTSASYMGPYTIKVTKTTPVPIKAVSISGDHTLILKTDGTLWATGKNDYGQLGDGTSTDKTSPVQIATSVIGISAGYQFSLFIKDDNSLWAMGYNYNGQLGDGSTVTRSTPVKVMTGVAAVSAGYMHALILKTDGTAWGMGYNADGELGDSTTTRKMTPVQVLSGVKSVAAGYEHSLFVKTDSTLWATGWNSYGQLGDSTMVSKNRPKLIMSGVSDAAGGVHHSLVVKYDNTLWVMGSNSYGQLGRGSSSSSAQLVPIQVLIGVKAVSAGSYHSLLLKTDNSLWAVGQNTYGQVGYGTSSIVYLPVQIASGVTAISAPANGGSSMFIKSNGTLWATGSNTNGQFGDGTITSKTSPVQIAF